MAGLALDELPFLSTLMDKAAEDARALARVLHSFHEPGAFSRPSVVSAAEQHAIDDALAFLADEEEGTVFFRTQLLLWAESPASRADATEIARLTDVFQEICKDARLLREHIARRVREGALHEDESSHGDVRAPARAHARAPSSDMEFERD